MEHKPISSSLETGQGQEKKIWIQTSYSKGGEGGDNWIGFWVVILSTVFCWTSMDGSNQDQGKWRNCKNSSRIGLTAQRCLDSAWWLSSTVAGFKKRKWWECNKVLVSCHLSMDTTTNFWWHCACHHNTIVGILGGRWKMKAIVNHKMAYPVVDFKVCVYTFDTFELILSIYIFNV